MSTVIIGSANIFGGKKRNFPILAALVRSTATKFENIPVRANRNAGPNLLTAQGLTALAFS
jgi:hypothetical protein